MHILFLEDDTVLASILIDFLRERYEVTHTYSMKEALRLSEECTFDLYIFDINLPDGSGISLLRKLREFHDTTPAIFITAFHDVKHLKEGFEAGANDFIRKPFELEELSQRIENIKKHFGLGTLVEIAATIHFDTQKHTLMQHNTIHKLSAKESNVLHYLYKNRHRVVSADEMLQNLWNYDEMPSGDAVRTLIKELRKYVGHEHIKNIRGEGYKFE
ncbi:MAG: response regulator transcription factor [Sulfurimonas sp.]|nr:response regulator transcription factor [Sulfurimonas sp.]MDD3060331.1 response regulator transcription factor [Sulfurimonas sp.]MDD5202543.1 response regulator transcription factor [Sulfurimonas sp.]